MTDRASKLMPNKEYHQKWRDGNRQRVVDYQRAWRKRNRVVANQRTLAWSKTPKGIESCLNTAYKRRYRITFGQYQTMLENQNHQCAICGRKDGSDKRRLFVDHCHKTEVIRGLVCYRCNTGLACFGDSLETIKKAVAYLEAIAKAEGGK